jgi:hypothetical protein
MEIFCSQSVVDIDCIAITLSMVTIVQCKTVCRNRAALLPPVAVTLEYTALYYFAKTPD